MSDNPRIEELRRRVQADPASIAFAALAEEYRRAGHFNDAIETCVAGLKRHPSYLSAHVTLGRALIEVGRFDEAAQELQLVLKAAPENLAAIRGLADIHHRRRDQGYDEASSALSSLHDHQQEEAAQAAAAHAAASAEAPPVYAPPVYAPPAHETAYEPPAYEAPAAEPAAATFEPPAPTPACEPPAPTPAYEPPAPAYDPPQYDPPGTFEFPHAAAAAPAFDAPAFDTPAFDAPAHYALACEPDAPAAVAEHRSPQLDALERFLDAIVTSRSALQAH